jgi:hypothetical protein
LLLSTGTEIIEAAAEPKAESEEAEDPTQESTTLVRDIFAVGKKAFAFPLSSHFSRHCERSGVICDPRYQTKSQTLIVISRQLKPFIPIQGSTPKANIIIL